MRTYSNVVDAVARQHIAQLENSRGIVARLVEGKNFIPSNQYSRVVTVQWHLRPALVREWPGPCGDGVVASS